MDAPAARGVRAPRGSPVDTCSGGRTPRSLHARRRGRGRRFPAQARGSLPPWVLAPARLVLPERRCASHPTWTGSAGRTARRRRMELSHAQPAEHAPQLLPHHVQRARGPAHRIRARSGRGARLPRLRSASARVHARAPALPVRQDRAVITDRFTHLTYPWHWHYTVLRGLDYMRLTPAIDDERADDPIQLLRDRRKPNGRWPLQKRIPGTLLVEMEKPGTDSRWNTLRALRVLRRRDNATS